MLTNIEAFTSTSREQVAFVTQSMREWSKGVQVIGTEVLSFGTRSLEEGARSLEQLMSARTIEEAIEVQNHFAKQRYEDWVNQLGKISTAFVSMSKAAYSPIEHAVSHSVFVGTEKNQTKH